MAFARYGDGFVATDNAGLFYGGGIAQLAVQAIGVVIVAVFVLTTTGALFAIMKRTMGIRVTEEEELEGLDVGEHGAHGYGLEPTSIM